MQVSFYELPASAEAEDNAMISHMVELISSNYQNRQYLTVVCCDKKQAEAIDEFIWQQPSDKFIAHNLQGEGPANGSPVELTWLSALDSQPIRNKKLVINISNEFLTSYAFYQHIVDFVPSEETLKIAARERYKQYKQAGCKMVFVNANINTN
jgi:DNA polymerase-3 subunit chi